MGSISTSQLLTRTQQYTNDEDLSPKSEDASPSEKVKRNNDLEGFSLPIDDSAIQKIGMGGDGYQDTINQ